MGTWWGAELSLCLHLAAAEGTRIAWCKLFHPRQGAKGEENCMGAKGKGGTCQNWAQGGLGLGEGRQTGAGGVSQKCLGWIMGSPASCGEKARPFVKCHLLLVLERNI